ncbi:MAG TPA: GNAT family N-acetyltransferase [Longimicrobium sp.]|nr:GNAT family N-acetyltransferase [Longimicrobium sp.]
MRLHVETLFTHDAAGRMVGVNEPNGKDAPRFFLGRAADGGRVWRVRHDVDDTLTEALEAACLAEQDDDSLLRPPYGSAPYEELVSRSAPVERIWTGPAYRFPADLSAAPDAVKVTAQNADVLRPHLEAWLGDVATGQPMAAALADGRAVSVCCSVRIGARAHEAGVETVPEFRGRGHAAQVVVAWAAAVRAMGVVPLYSTSWENTRSQALARKLGLRRYGSTLHVT